MLFSNASSLHRSPVSQLPAANNLPDATLQAIVTPKRVSFLKSIVSAKPDRENRCDLPVDVERASTSRGAAQSMGPRTAPATTPRAALPRQEPSSAKSRSPISASFIKPDAQRTPAAPGLSSAAWIERWDPKSQRTYWRNAATGEAQWQRPVFSRPATTPSLEVDGDCWVERFDAGSQRSYWRSSTTGRAQWKRPSAAAASAGRQLCPTPGAGSPLNTEDKLYEDRIQSAFMPVSVKAGEGRKLGRFHPQAQRKYRKSPDTGKLQWKDPSQQAVKALSRQGSTSDACRAISFPSPEKATDDIWDMKFATFRVRGREFNAKPFWVNRITGRKTWVKPSGDGSSSRTSNRSFATPRRIDNSLATTSGSSRSLDCKSAMLL